MDMIKTLWYVRKARIYEALVHKMMYARDKLKLKQATYKERAEYYKAKVLAGRTVDMGKGT
jgi:hypothetical protein